MNERFQALLDEASDWVDEFGFDSTTYASDRMNKFAELIVKECAETIRVDLQRFPKGDLTWKCAMEESAQIVEKHFGVK